MNYHDVHRIVARCFGLKVKELMSHSQSDQIIKVRSAAIRINHDLLKYSFNRLKRIYGKRSHNTIGNAYRNSCDLYDTDKQYRDLYDKAHAEAVIFINSWKPRKQLYNLHYRLREKELRVDSKHRIVSINPDKESLITASGQLKKLLKQHNYSVQYSLI
jgi:hypothetical protein